MHTTNKDIDAGGPWDIGMEKSPLVTFNGEQSVVVENFRNFHYKLDGSHEENYETRTVPVSELEFAEFVIVPFANQPSLAHTMMSFGTRDGRHTAVSIEARRRLNQNYGVVKGMFGSFPLMYVIADERDVIGQRTKIRGDEVYLFRIKATPEQVQEFFLCVMQRVDKLSREPETYNSITNNCLTNIRTHMNRIWPKSVPWNWRILINAHSGYLAYKLGLLDTDESFAVTQEKANITAQANENWRREDFSKRIREPACPGGSKR